jgi:recombination protein RecA
MVSKLKANKVSAPSPVLSGKQEAINTAMQQIEKQFGAGSIMKLGEGRAHMIVETIPTGAIGLDLALGAGGIPKGRVSEIYGPEASGKTTLCLHVIAEAQKRGGTAAFIDAEHALDPSRAKGIGVNLDELLISQPDTGEQALEITETLIRSGAVDVIVIDSVAALVPKAEIEGEMGDAMVGVQARLMSQALRKLTGAINKSKAVVIFTNQLREKIGVMFGSPETTSGGRALKFYASVRIDMRKIGNISEGEKIVGSRHRAKIVKNKIAAPFRVVEFDIMNSGGISRSGSILDVAIEQGVIEKSGSFFRFEGEMLAQGREATKSVLEEKPELSHKIEKAIWTKIKAEQQASPENAQDHSA